VLQYLQATQMADGHWTQNMWVSGAAFQTGIQLGETALPILLVDLLVREQALSPAGLGRYWPMVRRAAEYIVHSGPSTQEDRWENERGYTPFTVATVIAALLVAADLAEEQGEPEVSAYLRETADAWNAAIESWLYVVGTDLARRVGVGGYYARIIPPELSEDSTPRIGHLRRKEGDTPRRDRPVPGVGGPAALGPGIPIDEIVSPDVLALVRFGLRAADDPRIVNTVKVIPAKIPERGLFPGRPTGSAMPLVWAHAEYLKLRRSLLDGRIFDQPAQTVRRFLQQKAGSNRVIWRRDCQRRLISAGEMLRIELPAPALIRWTRDGWRASTDKKTRDTGLNVHVADLETENMKSKETIEMTFYWIRAARWEGSNYVVTVV
jgi:GH15 family glucan-1,4-alpha-glucosidase